ncbi:MAG TPA: VOC family protein [Candidatus Baltobacteraceae bacterium]|nr:VOC family protein [Candidatus Baltobacteraceae bacterium]
MSTTAVATQTIYPALRYRDAHAALAWLEKAFGATKHAAYEEDGVVVHAEVAIAGNMIMFGQERDDSYPVRSPASAGCTTGAIYVVLPDATAIDAMFARATAAGAKVQRRVNDTGYGSHEFGVLDLDGNPWSFGTYRPMAHP